MAAGRPTCRVLFTFCSAYIYSFERSSQLFNKLCKKIIRFLVFWLEVKIYEKFLNLQLWWTGVHTSVGLRVSDMVHIICQGLLFPTKKFSIAPGFRIFGFLMTCLFWSTFLILSVQEGRGSVKRYRLHLKDISEYHTNNWWRPQVAIVHHFEFIHFFSWSDESVVVWISAYILACANFVKKWSGVSQNLKKH